MASDFFETYSASIEALKQTDEWREHRAGVRCVACSPDDVWTATADSSRKVALWQNGEVVSRFDPVSFWERFPSSRRIHALAFSLDSATLFVALTDGLAAFEVPSGRRLWRYRGRRMLAFLASSAVGLAVHPTNGSVAAAFDDGHLGLWSAEGQCQEFWFDNDAPRFMAFTRDGAKLVGTDGFSVCLWEMASHAKIARHVPDEKVHALAASPMADIAASRNLYRINMWNLETGADLGSAEVTQGLPLIAFSPTSERLAYSEKHLVRVVNFLGLPVSEAHLPGTIALALSFTADGRHLLAGCSDGVVRVYEAA